jgi:hypothetical protein
MTASNRDLLLVLGIIVALIISIATWYHSTTSQANLKIESPLSPQKNASQVVKKIGRAVVNLTQLAEFTR